MALWGSGGIIGHPTSMKMALITLFFVSKWQPDPVVSAWWVEQITAERGAQKGAHVPCVSALADWEISVSSSFSAVSQQTLPTCDLLDVGLCWHLSFSRQSSVVPSISMADSPRPWASLTPSFGSFTAHCQQPLKVTAHSQDSWEPIVLDCATK